MGSLAYPSNSIVEITRAEFEKASAHLLERARACLFNALKVINTKPEDIDRVLLVGGSSYIPAVRKLLADVFTCPLSMDVPPDLAVSIGTAIFAASLMGQTDVMLIDGYAWGIGHEVVVARESGLQLVYEPLSKPNTTIPYSVSKTYSLLSPDQKEIEVKVYQTLNPRATSLAEVIYTGKSAVITDIPKSESGIPHAVEVDFTIDVNQTINLKARIPATNQELSISFNSSELRLENPQDVAKAKAEVEELWATNPHNKQIDINISSQWIASTKEPSLELNTVESALERRAQMIAEMADAEQREIILRILSRLRQAREANDLAAIERAEDELIDLLADL